MTEGVVRFLILYATIAAVNFGASLTLFYGEEYWAKYAEDRGMDSDIVFPLVTFFLFPLSWMHNICSLLIAVVCDLYKTLTDIGSSQVVMMFRKRQ